MVRVAHQRTITDLIHAPDKANNVGEPRIMTLSWDTSPKQQLLGAFKMAYIGYASDNLFGNSTAICIKQLFYNKAVDFPSTPSGSSAVQEVRRVIHDPVTQARDLVVDLLCIVWAHGLLKLVYEFIDHQVGSRLFNTTLPFVIPQMRFVQAALAVDQAADAEQQTYLLEEVVDPTVEGRFRKYINNNSAGPLSFASSEDTNRADFLAFSQHVQYWKTKKLVFVSDYQGKSNHTFWVSKIEWLTIAYRRRYFAQWSSNHDTRVCQVRFYVTPAAFILLNCLQLTGWYFRSREPASYPPIVRGYA